MGRALEGDGADAEPGQIEGAVLALEVAVGDVEERIEGIIDADEDLEGLVPAWRAWRRCDADELEVGAGVDELDTAQGLARLAQAERPTSDRAH